MSNELAFTDSEQSEVKKAMRNHLADLRRRHQSVREHGSLVSEELLQEQEERLESRIEDTKLVLEKLR